MRLRRARLDYRFGYRGRRDRPRGSHGDGCAGRPGMGLGRCPGRESRRRSWSAHGYQDPHPRSALLQRVTSMNLFGTVIRVTPSYGATIGMGRRIAAPENVPEPSSIASPNLLSLPHRTRPEPELFFIFLISITCWCGPCGVVGDATASSKRSGKSIGLWGKPGLSSQAGILPADGPIDQHR